MRRVLQVISTTGPGGGETIAVELATGLARAGWESFVALPGPGWIWDTLVSRGVSPQATPLGGSFDLRYLLKLISLVRRLRIDVLHTHFFTPAVYGAVVGRLTGIPVISTFHGVWDLEESRRFRRVKWGLIRGGTNRLVFVSEALRGQFATMNLVSGDRMEVVPNGIVLEAFSPDRDSGLRQELGLAAETVLIGAVGNVRPAKGYATFLRAAAILRERHPNFRFVVAGDVAKGLGTELDELRRSLGLADTFRFLGFREDVSRFMRGLDLFVQPSDSEGFSLTVVQALASGLPIVATRSGGPEEILGGGEHGVLVEPRNPGQLADAISELWADPVRREKFAQQGPALARTRYDATRMVTDYQRLYARAAGVPRGDAFPG